ncbi:MAG: glycerol-3-phosphate 1-O-acyltransferase PlsY [Alphaproteobacteria bacterium]
MSNVILTFALAYLIGSIPFGFLLTKFFAKQDIRDIGSGNIGATNVLRTGNKALAALTLILDGGKGAFAVFILPFLLPFGVSPLAIGLFAMIGHCFPIWLKFKGGKGVATSLGVLLAAAPWVGLAACGAWLASAFLFRISSLAALVAIGLAPLFAFFIYGAVPAGICAVIAALVFWRHKDNIARLLKGEEPKIGKK